MAKNKGYILNYLLIAFFLTSYLHAQKLDFKHVAFKKADSIANSYQDASLNNLPVLAYRLTHNLDTPVEKFRAIYIWVCNTIESDYGFGEQTLHKRRKYKNNSLAFTHWNTQVQSKMFKRLLRDKKTVCSGYAYLIKELCALVDINCKIVDGYSRTVNNNIGEANYPNHSWNAVELNNKWYLVDATLASGFFDVNAYKFIKNYNDGYFLTRPELFIKNHYPLDKKWTLLADNITLNVFVKGPIIYSNTIKYGVVPVLPIQLVTKVFIDEAVTFKLKLPDAGLVDKISVVLNGKSNKINYKRYDEKNKQLELRYNFPKKGTYDVHIKLDNVVVVSYTVKVIKQKGATI